MAKILDIIPYKILPAHMGGQKGIAMFCKYLGEKNELTTVSVEDNQIDLAETYSMIPLFSKKTTRYMNPFYVFKIEEIVQKKQIKNVITEHPYMAWMGWFLKKSLGVKWFIHTHNIEFERFRTLNKSWFRFLKTYEGWVYNNADMVFFKTNEDIDFAVNNKMIKRENAFLVPFGIEIKGMPADKSEQRKKIFEKHNIPADAILLLFNGTFDYKPNADALKFILDELNPLLLKEKAFNYRVMICGKGLPASFNDLKNFSDKNILYAGFVEDVYAYFKAADIFINPVISGGGVKTKVVEAIAYGTTVISSKTGAAGIELSVCGEKLKVVPDNEAEVFAKAILATANNQLVTPNSYYNFYFWGNIVAKLQAFFKA